MQRRASVKVALVEAAFELVGRGEEFGERIEVAGPRGDV